MSGGHNHNHHHHFQSSRARLSLAFWTQAAFFVVELVGGILSNSLALLADAGHMLSDVAALGLSLLALHWALRSPTAQKTFGYHRLEILVALVNGLVLWAMAGYIFYEAVGRIFQPPEISSTPPVGHRQPGPAGQPPGDVRPDAHPGARHQPAIGLYPSAVRFLRLLCRGAGRPGHLVAEAGTGSTRWPASSWG